MVRIDRIVTRGGDKGETSLGDGSRIRKDSKLIEAIGAVDEANAAIGLIRAAMPQAAVTGEAMPREAMSRGAMSRVAVSGEPGSAGAIMAETGSTTADTMLGRIQNDLFDLGADLCVPGEGGDRLRLTDAPVLRLENEVEAMNEALPPLNSFILPGGTEAASRAHMARTVARRAERAVAGVEGINPAVFRYLNRLSDHLFVLARVLNHNGAGDVLWVPGANR